MALHTAKFHLDKLVDDGLLDVEYRRPLGRGGPGAGRPSKLYRRSSLEVAVSVPERSYELAGRLLAQAVTVAEGEDIPISAALRRAAREEGHSLGAKVLERAGSKGRSAIRDATTRVLADRGYEPRHDSGGVTLVKLPLSLLGQGLHRPCLRDESRCDRRLAFFSRPNRIQSSARPRLGQVLRSTTECRGTARGLAERWGSERRRYRPVASGNAAACLPPRPGSRDGGLRSASWAVDDDVDRVGIQKGFSQGSPGVGTLVPRWTKEGGDRQTRLVKSFGPRWDLSHNGAEGVSRRRVGVTEGDRGMGQED